MTCINTKTALVMPNDPAEYYFRQKRMAHWNQVSPKKENPRRLVAFYHKLLQYYYAFLIPPRLWILELGCGHGDLLAHLKASVGVGINLSGEMTQVASKKYPNLNFIQADAHEIEFSTKFDVIILSDLINDLRDVQRVIEKMRNVVHGGTRPVINFYNNLWRVPLSFVWFFPHDVSNLMKLSGFEVVHRRQIVLLSLKIPFVSKFLNRYLVHLPPFSWFALPNIVIARPDP